VAALIQAAVRGSRFLAEALGRVGEEMADVLVRHLARIGRLARSQGSPLVALVTRSSVKIVPT
jgi:hypothetical protein